MDPVERDLRRRAFGGDREALGLLLDRYAPRLRVTVLSAGVPAAEADDAVQEALVRALAHWDELRDAAALGGWLGAIARNVAADCLRRRGREFPRPTELDRASDAEPVAPARAIAETADLLIPGVSPEAMAILQLRYGEELSGPEIAARLGLSVEAAKKRLQRARAAALAGLNRRRV